MPRSLWTGAISFGLVNIPVKMFRATATQSARSVGFHQLHDKCGTRLQHKRWCPLDDEEVSWEHVVKGYEVSKGHYVKISEKDLDQLLPDDDYAAVAIEDFVAIEEVDPIFYDRSYYLSPDGSPKAYALLYEAMEHAGKVAIARVTLRTRQHLAIVRAHDQHLVLSTMFFADEIVDATEVPGLPAGKAGHADKKQLAMAEQLIESMTSHFQPEKYKDDYAERVEKLIEQKINEGEVTEGIELPAQEHGVVNLMDALKRSLKSKEAGEAAEPKAKAAPHRQRRQAARRTHHSKKRAS